MSFVYYPFKILLIIVAFLLAYFVGFFPWKIQAIAAYFPAWLIRRSSRWQIILRNYELCFPEWDEQKRVKIAREQCHYVACMPLIMLNSLHREKIVTSQVKRVEGLQYLHQLKAEKKGCLLLSGHFTAMDVANRFLSQHLQVAAVYQKGEEGVSNYLMEKVRQRLNTPLIEKTQTVTMVRHLRKGGLLWYAPDQNHGGKMKEKLTFFGREVNTVVGWDRMLKSSGAELCLLNMYYEEGGYVIQICPPFDNYKEMTSAEIAQHYLLFLEENIRLFPQQYYWVHRRFKSQAVTYE